MRLMPRLDNAVKEKVDRNLNNAVDGGYLSNEEPAEVARSLCNYSADFEDVFPAEIELYVIIWQAERYRTISGGSE